MSFHTTLPGFSAELFSATYSEARQAWRKRAERCPGVVWLREFPHPLSAPDAPLECQAAWLGPEDASSVVVLIAATHGVEGYAGSAVQCDLLARLASGEQVLPGDTALLLIHGLNPWGCANFRRCDDQGIDVNRNFVDFTSLPPNPGYSQLKPLLELQDAQLRRAKLTAAAERIGQTAYEIAVSGGQYSDPDGPFYGGRAPSFSRRVIEALIDDYGLAERRLAVVDVHTGLGAYGYGEVICDHTPGSGGANTAASWYGPGCTLPLAGTSSSVPKEGLLDYAWHRIMDSGSCFVTLEFGTYSTDALFDVLLDEALAWRQGRETAKKRAAQAMVNHFFPEDNYWREAVIFRARQVIAQALVGVSNESQ